MSISTKDIVRNELSFFLIEKVASRHLYALGWKKMPPGWTKDSMKKFWSNLTGNKKHKVTECINKMEKHLGEGAGGFCAGLADEMTPGWRSEVRKHNLKK